MKEIVAEPIQTDQTVRGGRGAVRGAGTVAGRGAGQRGAGTARRSQVRVETRTCRLCHEVGHLGYDCPTYSDERNGDAYLVEEEEEFDGFVVCGECDPADCDVVVEGNFVAETRRTGQFVATDLLLDNQASQHVFCNIDLLHNVAPIVPYSLGGIDAAGAV